MLIKDVLKLTKTKRFFKPGEFDEIGMQGDLNNYSHDSYELMTMDGGFIGFGYLGM